jgi:hypothetical protein
MLNKTLNKAIATFIFKQIKSLSERISKNELSPALSFIDFSEN